MERMGNWLEGPWVDPRILGLWLPFDPWSRCEPALDPKILGARLAPLNRSVSHWGITLWVPWFSWKSDWGTSNNSDYHKNSVAINKNMAGSYSTVLKYMDRSCGEMLSKMAKLLFAGQILRVGDPDQVLDLLTLSGLPLIPVTSLTGMLKKEVSFLSWLIVIWVPS